MNHSAQPKLTLQQISLSPVLGAPALMYHDPKFDVIIAVSPQGVLALDPSSPTAVTFHVQVIMPVALELTSVVIFDYVKTVLNEFDLCNVTAEEEGRSVATGILISKQPPRLFGDRYKAIDVRVVFPLSTKAYQTAVDVLRGQVEAIDLQEHKAELQAMQFDKAAASLAGLIDAASIRPAGPGSTPDKE